MACPEPEALAQLAAAGGDSPTRSALADHAAGCESCHAALVALVTAAEAAQPREAATVERVGRYVLERRLGAGGMGVVHEATDPELGRSVAIKMIRRGASAERLRREAQALARLAHPNVVTVYDVGEHDGQVFVAMALVDGDNLRQWLARGPRATREILDVLVRAGRGVAAAHQAGLVHRDLKPDNIFVARTGEVQVGDFGLAREAGDDDAQTEEQLATAATQLTMTGMVLGTPAYMAPEQAEGSATEASDQFSFCITAFEALHGVRPFPGDTFEELQGSIRAGRLTEPAKPRPLPARVARALRRGLAPAPADRFPTMTALVAALEPRPSRLRRAAPLMAVAAIAGAIAAMVMRESHGPACGATRDELAATWNPARRSAVAGALATQRVTPQAVGELAGELDHYATRWGAVREEVCVAEGEHRLPAEQLAARRGCLETRAAELAAAIRQVETARAPDPLGLWQRISSLTPAEACRDDATARLSVGAAGHRELMTAIAALDLRAKDVHELDGFRARADGDRPALLALELVQGRFLIDNGSAAQADAPLQRALALAEQLGVAPARVHALALLARSACKQGRFDASAPLLVMADADAARDSASEAEVDLVKRARAECLYQRHAPEAVPLLTELIAHCTERYGADSPQELDLHLQLGESDYSLGRIDDGKRELAAFDRIWARYELPGAQAAQREDDAASTAFRNGDLALATEHQHREVELWGTDHLDDRATALATLALMYEVGGDWQVAAATHDELVQLVPSGTGTSASLRVESLVQGGIMKLQLGDLAGAAARLDQAAGEAHELGRADLANDAEIGRGRVAVERGDFARGARILRDALPTFSTRPDASPYRTGVAQFALARALFEIGETAAAIKLAGEAETNVGQGVADAKANPLGTRLVAPRAAQLEQITRWRDRHPSLRTRNR